MAELNPRALAVLRCPHCGGPLQQIEQALGCDRGHRFDLARQGYVSLLGPRSRTDTADSPDMVAARVEFLSAGHYAPIAAAVATAVSQAPAGVVGDIGAGTGYYLAAVTGPDRPGLAVDSSRYAARRSAAVPGVLSVVADAWSALPIGDRTLSAVLNVFAPRDFDQLARVLRPGGLLVAVTPEPGHLEQVREQLGMLTVDAGKADRLQDAAGSLTPVDRRRVRFEVGLGAADLAALVRMGPAARHRSREQIAASVADLADRTTPVTVDVTLSLLRRP